MWGFWLTSLASIDPASWRKEQKKNFTTVLGAHASWSSSCPRPPNSLGWLKEKHLKTPPSEQFFLPSLVRNFRNPMTLCYPHQSHVSCISTTKVLCMVAILVAKASALVHVLWERGGYPITQPNCAIGEQVCFLFFTRWTKFPTEGHVTGIFWHLVTAKTYCWTCILIE